MTIYLVCYNLREDPSVQLQQILHWLEYLNGILDPANSLESSWQVIVVGLCADECIDIEAAKSIIKVDTWKSKIRNIPICSTFMVSSHHKRSSLRKLLSELERQYKYLFSTHAIEIPTVYRNILEHIQAQGVHNIAGISPFWNTKTDVHRALKYLHSIGEIVYLPNGMIFSDPSTISSIFAHFVSPIEVQRKLESELIAQEAGVPKSLLSVDKISSILKISTQSTKYVSSRFS